MPLVLKCLTSIKALLAVAIAVCVLVLSPVTQGQAFAQKATNRQSQQQKNLEMTQEQVAKLKAIRKASKARATTLTKALSIKRKRLMAYVAIPKADEATALKLSREVSQVEAKIHALRVKTWFRMRDVMTPEQVEQFTRMRRAKLTAKKRRSSTRAKSRKTSTATDRNIRVKIGASR